MADADFQTRRWTRVEYDRLIECGFFQPGDPVELLGGQLIVAEPLGSHPSRPVLVVEVSESSLALDRVRKASLYARAGLTDYWIVNLVGRVLEVYREPRPDADTPFGWGYRSRSTHGPDASVSPLAAPHASVRVSGLVF